MTFLYLGVVGEGPEIAYAISASLAIHREVVRSGARSGHNE